MKTKYWLLAMALMGIGTSQAAIVGFDLSPAGTDNAIGLSPLNETSVITNSTGSGNEIGSGITFNTETLTLTLSVGYGSAFGFTDLTGPAVGTHIHGPATTNTPAAILNNLASLLVSNSASGGAIVGSVVLSTNQAADLLAGLNYLNVHTAANPGGEIRGQLIPVNVLPTLVCPASTNVECTGGNGTLVTIDAQVADEDGDPITVVWSANGVSIQTNSLAAGSTNLVAVPFSGLYQLGTNVVTVSATDGLDAAISCSANVVVVDTTPPVITSASLSTNVLWPPNHKMVPVQVSVTATDLCGTVTTRIKSISSNQGVLTKGSGHTSKDWKIVNDSSAQIRAERSGKDKNGRTYTITVEAVDNSGNASSTNLTVFVPHDQGNHSTNVPASNPPGNSNSGGNGNGHGNSNGHGRNK